MSEKTNMTATQANVNVNELAEGLHGEVQRLAPKMSDIEQQECFALIAQIRVIEFEPDEEVDADHEKINLVSELGIRVEEILAPHKK